MKHKQGSYANYHTFGLFSIKLPKFPISWQKDILCERDGSTPEKSLNHKTNHHRITNQNHWLQETSGGDRSAPPPSKRRADFKNQGGLKNVVTGFRKQVKGLSRDYQAFSQDKKRSSPFSWMEVIRQRGSRSRQLNKYRVHVYIDRNCLFEALGIFTTELIRRRVGP